MYFSKIALGLATLASMATATPAPVEVPESSLAVRDHHDMFARSSGSFSCPKAMGYCAWTKSCSCSPGMSYDQNRGTCVGTRKTGCWDEPKASAYAGASVSVSGSVGASVGGRVGGSAGGRVDSGRLAPYCACSPYKIVKYNKKHAYCQASLDNIVFLADVDLEAEISAYGGAEISVGAGAGISTGLKGVCGGLAGLYLESAAQAATLYNTDQFGFAVGINGVVGGFSGGIIGAVSGIACFLGLGSCQSQTYDCVSYCTKGCKNYIDVKAKLGASISGLVGFCIAPGASVLLTIGAAGAIVSTAVEGLLCTVGNVLGGLTSTFGCSC